MRCSRVIENFDTNEKNGLKSYQRKRAKTKRAGQSVYEDKDK